MAMDRSDCLGGELAVQVADNKDKNSKRKLEGQTWY